MKTRLHLPLVTALVAAAAGLFIGTPSQAASFQFSQGGFDGGGQITGHFDGVDLDHDGWIFGGELSAFSLSFSGNAQVAAFTHALGNGSGPGNFAYRLGSGTFEPTPYGGLWTMGLDGDNDGLRVMRYASFEFEALGEAGRVTDMLGGTTTRTDDLLRTLGPLGVPIGRVNELDDVLADAQVLHNRALAEVPHGDAGRVRLARQAARFDRQPLPDPRPAPHKGEHGATLLAELGLSVDEVAALAAQGVVRLPRG